MNEYWAQGFEKRCQEHGVDPNALIKWASDKDESGMRPVLRGWGKEVTRGFGAGAAVGALTGLTGLGIAHLIRKLRGRNSSATNKDKE